MIGSTPLTWSLPGLADELALSSAAGRLWVAASTATLANEGVWFGEVARNGIVGATPVMPGTACGRPAIAAIAPGAVLALACAPGGELGGAYRRADVVTHWRLAVDGTPIHASAVALDGAVWIAVELARGAERSILVAELGPGTGVIRRERRLGGGATWCRWPALAVRDRELVVAWCEGPARSPGTVRIARGERRIVDEVSRGPGDAPALAILPDGRIAVAWHRGGPAQVDDGRDASVVRALELAIVDVEAGTVDPASPPAGAGGASPRGEDQGWELAAVAADPAGAVWLVGRSSHGHQLARRDPAGRWTGPAALDAAGWGGRGRRHALAFHDGAVWLARRAPDGIALAPCAAPGPEPGPAAPAIARVARPAPRTVARVRFGDLHQHTAHSDGCGALEDLWLAARDARGLDFAAITDHDQFCRRALGPATWRTACEIAAGFDEPGRFVALAGYEFTGPRHPGPGHKCVYFGDRVPDRVPDKDVAAVFEVARAFDAIAVPHHVAWTGADLAHHDPAIQPVWEICSVHGCYEAEGGCGAHPPRADHVIPGQFVRDALDAGLRFGFIGSTDSHGLDWHHGIARWRNPFHAGLACVVDAEPTRAGILAALRARRCYATSGARIGLRVELDGAPLGSELPPGTRGELVVEVDGTAPVTRIVMVDAGGERVLDHRVAGDRATARAAVGPLEPPGYLYVRVEQEDGEMAWASPLWLG